MNILVTGASKGIGNAIAQELQNDIALHHYLGFIKNPKT